MNKSLLTLFILSTFIISVQGNSFNQGFFVGTLINSFDYDNEDVRESNKIDDDIYIYTIYDTDLLPFKPKDRGMCIEIKKSIPLTYKQKIFISLSYSLLLFVFIHMLCFADDDQRDFMVGYMVASTLQKRRNRRYRY